MRWRVGLACSGVAESEDGASSPPIASSVRRHIASPPTPQIIPQLSADRTPDSAIKTPVWAHAYIGSRRRQFRSKSENENSLRKFSRGQNRERTIDRDSTETIILFVRTRYDSSISDQDMLRRRAPNPNRCRRGSPFSTSPRDSLPPARDIWKRRTCQCWFSTKTA